ncbi:unnamed protein product [Closterium sp. NIES-65]|nr:unnamed protein product [Closterium sp. NIES-65]
MLTSYPHHARITNFDSHSSLPPTSCSWTSTHSSMLPTPSPPSPPAPPHRSSCQPSASQAASEGRAAGGRAAGQQRRPHQWLRLQVLSFNPPSPRPLCISAPPPPAPPLLQLSAKSFASFSLASQVLSVDLGSASFLSFHSVKSHRWLGHDLQATDLPFLIPGKPLRFSGLSPSHLPCMLCSCTFTLRPLATYSPALRVCLAGGGEGCGVSTAIPSRLSPAAVQRGTHTGRLGGGLPGKESPGAAAAALCSLSLTAKFPQPLACLAMSCASVQVPPQVQPLGLQFVTWPPPVAPPLSRLANAVPSLALSPFIPSLATDQLCVCALQVEGRGGGQHRRFPTPLPRGRAGTRGDGREAALPIAAPRESIGVRCLIPSSLFLPPSPSSSLKEGGSTGARAIQRHSFSNLPPPFPSSSSHFPAALASWRSERLW